MDIVRDGPLDDRRHPDWAVKGNSIAAFAVGQTSATLEQPMYVATHGMPIADGSQPLRPASPVAVKQSLNYHTPVQKLPPRVP